MQRKHVSLYAFFVSLSVIAFPIVSLSQSEPVCYIRDRSGRTINLEQLCRRPDIPSSSEDTQVSRTIATEYGISFRPVYQHGELIRVDLLAPDGSVAQPGENITLSNGRTIRLPPSGAPSVGVWMTETRSGG